MSNVLIACEESQVVCKSFREFGHNAFSCDLKDCSGGHPEWHIIGDVSRIINGNCCFETDDLRNHFIKGSWDLIIAHPPCTYLSKAGACRMFHYFDDVKYINYDRYQKMLAAKDFFNFIFNCNAKRLCIENPTPLYICDLPPHDQVIQPYMFGDPYSKRTLLWLRNLPQLKPTKVLSYYQPYLPSNCSKFSKGFGGSRGVAVTQVDRSKTFDGIGYAMASQWSILL